MQLPEELQYSPALRDVSEALTRDYREGGCSPFGDEAKWLAYLGARMPATYVAVRKVLEHAPPFSHLLDLGAGPGTASWAAVDRFPSIQKITLVEKCPKAIALGQRLAQGSSHPALRGAEWIQQSLTEPIFAAGDAAILSYVLNELKDPEELVERCWEKVQILILVEPGTPKAFHWMRKIRQRLIELKAHLIAPCPHSFACPIQGSDWCHFSVRVERSRLHRLLKGGTLGYEDEKFSYLIASKNSSSLPSSGRILRRPIQGSGHVRLCLCNPAGKREEKIVSRKDKELYRKARDVEWGDLFS